MKPLKPLQQMPSFEIATLHDESWNLGAREARKFILVSVFRNTFCPICRDYLVELEHRIDEFTELDVDVIAISADSEENTRNLQTGLGLEKLTLGFGLDIDYARETLGLYITNRYVFTKPLPDVFTEPAMFLVRADGTLHSVCIGSAVYTRVPVDAILRNIGFLNAHPDWTVPGAD